eukprot:761171-Hanusia_phi.AAC.3
MMVATRKRWSAKGSFATVLVFMSLDFCFVSSYCPSPRHTLSPSPASIGSLPYSRALQCKATRTARAGASFPCSMQGKPATAIEGKRYTKWSLPEYVTRRNLLRFIGPVLVGSTYASRPTFAQDLVKEDKIGESVRKVASKIPGFGPKDVFYPESFRGKWNVNRYITGVDVLKGAAVEDQDLYTKILSRKDKLEQFSVRYIQKEDGTIADREYNTRQVLAMEDEKGLDVQWSASNPNVLTVSYPDGRIEERKVTKRSSSIGEDGSTAEFTEFVRLAQLQNAGSLTGVAPAPRISARWYRCRFRVVDADTIESIMLEYFLPDTKPDPKDAWMKVKYISRLKRIS